MREHRNLTLLLNVLLAGRTSLQPRRSDHFWASVPCEDGHLLSTKFPVQRAGSRISWRPSLRTLRSQSGEMLCTRCDPVSSTEAA
jgi:hypothetical protein